MEVRLLREQIEKIKNDIVACARACGRDPQEIKLLAVTKTHPTSLIQQALQNGIDCIAESRVQECEAKLPSLQGQYKEFHFIGHLQTNKIAKLLTLKPTLIHSIDKITTAEKLNQTLTNLHKTQDILIEVNTSGEPQKQGIAPEQLPALIQQCSQLANIRIKGLMTICELTTNEQLIRKSFKTLKRLFDEQKSMPHPAVDMQFLSMGMSDDYKIAIEEGSNLLRIGTALFGSRPAKKEIT